MSTRKYNNYRTLAELSLIPDNENPLFLFSQTHQDILLSIANGTLDAVQLARMELGNRGIDAQSGKWIGWTLKSTEDVFM